MRYFVQQNFKGGRVSVLNQNYKSKNCGDALKILSRELKVERRVYNIIEAFLKHKIFI